MHPRKACPAILAVQERDDRQHDRTPLFDQSGQCWLVFISGILRGNEKNGLAMMSRDFPSQDREVDPGGCGGGLVACIGRSRRLDQQNMQFPTRHGPMLAPFRHHKHLGLVRCDGGVPKFDVERACKHEEEIVGVVVLVPVERPSSLATITSLLL